MCEKEDKLCIIGQTMTCGYWREQQKQIKQLQKEIRRLAEMLISANTKNSELLIEKAARAKELESWSLQIQQIIDKVVQINF